MLNSALLRDFLQFRSLGHRVEDLGRFLLARYPGRRYPFYVQFLITARCNLRCVYCEVPPLHIDEMETVEIKAMMDELCNFGMRKLTITGGEPLLREDLPEIVRTVRERGVFCNIITNGILLGDRIDELGNLNLIMISIDGSEEINDKVRGGESHRGALRAIERCLEKGIPFCTHTVITRQNYDRLGYILDLSKEYGHTVLFQPIEIYHPASDTPRNRALLPTADQIASVADDLLRQKTKGEKIGHSRHSIKSWINRRHGKHCRWAGKLFCSILPDGKVVPCNPMMGKPLDWKSGRETGFINAMYQMPEFNCAGCFTGFRDVDRILSMDLRALY